MLIKTVFMLLLMTTAVSAQTYRWVDEGGALNFTDNYSDIPLRYRQQARIVEDSPANIMPGKTESERAKMGAGSLAGKVSPIKKTKAKKIRKGGDDKTGKEKRQRRHDEDAPQFVRTPARQAQDRIEEQQRRDRKALDDAQLPARRAMEQNEEQIRRARESISGH